MPSSLKSFFAIFLMCAATSCVLALFNGRDLASLIDLGSYVGALLLLLGAWRQYASNDALEQAHEFQMQQNIEATASGRDLPHKQVVPLWFSSGPLFFGGLAWLVALQTVRYTWHIAL